MREHDRLKQEMIRAAVRENLETINGGFSRGRARARHPALLGLLAATAAILVSFSIETTRAVSGSRHPSPAARTADLRPSPAAAAPAVLPAPRRIEPALFQLAVRKIVLDPGHGGTDPGARTSGLSEKEVTLDVGLRLADLLRKHSFSVVMTRETDETLSLERRVRFANEQAGDLLLSIHVNSIPVPERRGIETYYLGPTDDPRSTVLARAENSDSGYSLADFRRLLEGVYAGVQEQESRRLAESLQTGLYRSLHSANAALENRGVKSAPFVVLVGTQMPGILAEVSCISNAEEARLLKTPDYRQRIADALFAGLRVYAEARKQTLN
jgi:N-acetylmuramoyl-L-alanine amidase